VLPAEECQDVLEADLRTAFLRKPFRRSQLLEAIEQGLAQPLEQHRCG